MNLNRTLLKAGVLAMPAVLASALMMSNAFAQEPTPCGETQINNNGRKIMETRMKKLFLFSILVTAIFLVHSAALAWTPLAVDNDPVVRMPGTQPSQGITNMVGPLGETDSCTDCHGENVGQDPLTEPPIGGFWMGSMMGQAARDPIFWAAMTVAAQDSIWALGNPNATDICERCHFPEGWLAGRSDPTNASLMEESDFDGVHCDVCHRMFDPFFEETFAGTRESSDWVGYWDEVGNATQTGPSQPFATTTYATDQLLAADIDLFSGSPFFVTNLPSYSTYTENASGQFFISSAVDKRGPLSDHEAGDNHGALYSRYHKSKFFCSTCHDVSNPALANVDALNTLPDQSGGTDLITEQYAAFSYGHVERTFSEFMMSDYGRTVGGAAVNAEYAAQLPVNYNITNAGKCQDCHMREVTGTTDTGGIERPTDSTDHTAGVPVHDLQGGNIWITRILHSLIEDDDTTYDIVNEGLLVGRTADLTVDFTTVSWSGMNNGQLLDGALRAEAQLQAAATITDILYNKASGVLKFRVQNNTGHKLISGFPEGRRMFVNIKGSRFGSLIQEINPYDAFAGTLKGLNFDYTVNSDPTKDAQAPAAFLDGQEYEDTLVYEMKPSSTLTGETPSSFHFVLSDGRYKDNRIPPRGFTMDANAESRLVQTVYKGVEDTVGGANNYFTPAEYAGGYDAVTIQLMPNMDEISIILKYQGTSREYIQFLRDEINGTATTLSEPTFAQNNGLNSDLDSAYLVNTDPFFTGLRGWGDTIWELWLHNHGLSSSTPTNEIPGIVPFDMVSNTITDADPEMVDGFTVMLDADNSEVDEETSITFTATASGAGTYEYDFLMADANSNLVSQVGGYSTTDNFVLPTAIGDAGTVQVFVHAREVGSSNDYEATDDVTVTINALTTIPTSGGGGGCFIATAAYGSYWESHVMTLRQFRDSYLLTNKLGTRFVEAYYKYSPPMADYIAQHGNLRSIARVGLAPVVGFSWLAVNYGILAALAVLFGVLTMIIGGTCLVVSKREAR